MGDGELISVPMVSVRVKLSISFQAVGCDCSAKGDQIAKIARSYIDSENWLYTAYHSVGGSNTNKCNLFVADVLKEAGADAPNR